MVEFVIKKLAEIEAKIATTQPPKDDRTILDIDAVEKLTLKTKSTIYKLSRTKQIPSYKRGKKLYFIKEEVEDWLFKMPSITPKEEIPAPVTPRGRIYNSAKAKLTAARS